MSVSKMKEKEKKKMCKQKSGSKSSPHARARTSLLLLWTCFALANFLQCAQGKQTAYACEGTDLRLECDAGRVIHLIRAIYGRFSITICNENGNTEWSVNCGSPKSILVLNGTCNYQRSCSVMASTKTFGDPCPGTVKYLEVQYQCISASSLTSTTPRTTLLPAGSGVGVGGGRPNLVSPWLSPDNTKPVVPVLPSSSTPGRDQDGGRFAGNGSQYGLSSDFDGSSVSFSVTLPTPTTTSSSAPDGPRARAPVPAPAPAPALPPKQRGSDVRPVLGAPDNGGGAASDNDEYRVWEEDEDEADSDSDGDMTESSWDWAQFGRPKETDGGGGAPGMDGMWSDNTAENGNSGSRKANSSPTQSPPRGVPPTQTSRHGGRDAQDDVKLERGVSHPSSGRSAEHCVAKWDREMFWNWTVVGSSARQPCPGGASGLAKWRCIENSRTRLPVWFPDSPDLSDCKSAWFQSLLGRVLEDPNISNVAGDLAQVTSTKQMYGGDVAAAVKIIKTIAYRMSDQLRSLTNQVSREDLAAELLQIILDAGSNLLEKARLDPWRGLSYTDQMANATALLVGLEDNAFLLANVITSEKILRRSSKNILTTIYAIEASNVREINFPLESTDHWGRLGDVLTMPAEALRENSDGGLVRLVCFAYNNLEHVLQPIDSLTGGEESSSAVIVSTPRKIVNSRVISASLNQGRHIQLALPVQLTFRHLWLDNVSNPQCVFWDYTLNAWSEEGCRVVKSNRTHTECQCTHLTNFAILMDLKSVPAAMPAPQLLQVIMWVGSAVLILCLALTLLITHFCIHGKVFQTMILKNLFLCLLIGEIIFVLGIHETSRPWLCTPIALFQHYFALASILWLFLHGFHLHLIVVEAAESGLSRQVWYYGVSYGSPAIVVLLSFLLDTHGYRAESYCWIQPTFALLCFVGPAVIVALATAAVLLYTSYKVCGLLSAMPKKPNDDKALYVYTGTWLRGSLLILVCLTVSWTLRLVGLESDSPAVTYATALILIIEGIAILVFHALKAENLTRRFCDCGKGSASSDTEMSTHSQQQLQGGGLSGTHTLHGPGVAEVCHNNHLMQQTQQRVAVSAGVAPYLTMSRQPVDGTSLRAQESLYAKQLAAAGIQPSPGSMSGVPRYDPDIGMGGLYNKGMSNMDGHWTRGSSYSDIRNAAYHHREPVYEEIEKPTSPRASVSDLSEDESPHHHLYPHEIDLYNRSLYSPQRGIPHYQHRHIHSNSKDRRKGDLFIGGEATNPLLNRSQHLHSQQHAHAQQQQHALMQQQQFQQQLQQQHQQHQQQAAAAQAQYASRLNPSHRTPSEHLHHVAMKGLHSDEHILQNVHMV